jgi:hypothetical protein
VCIDPQVHIFGHVFNKRSAVLTLVHNSNPMTVPQSIFVSKGHPDVVDVVTVVAVVVVTPVVVVVDVEYWYDTSSSGHRSHSMGHAFR